MPSVCRRALQHQSREQRNDQQQPDPKHRRQQVAEAPAPDEARRIGREGRCPEVREPLNPAGTTEDASDVLTACAALASSAGDHSPHAVPAARMPSGVSSMRTAIATHSRCKEADAGRSVTPVASPCSPDVPRSNPGSATCRYATSPAEITASAIPAKVRCPIIMAGIAMLSGYGAYSGVPVAS